MWSRRAQEYEAKINSGDMVAIAEVVRDLTGRRPSRSSPTPSASFTKRRWPGWRARSRRCSASPRPKRSRKSRRRSPRALGAGREAGRRSGRRTRRRGRGGLTAAPSAARTIEKSPAAMPGFLTFRRLLRTRRKRHPARLEPTAALIRPIRQGAAIVGRRIPGIGDVLCVIAG